MVLHGRADIALVTRSYIGDFLQRHRQYAGQLLVSERVDQRYQHQVLLRPAAPISPQQLARLFEQLHGNGQLAAIFAPLRIAVRGCENIERRSETSSKCSRQGALRKK